jgi:hypothetical protein
LSEALWSKVEKMTNHTYTAVVTAENNNMLNTNNNDYDYTEREKKVIELYNQGKNTQAYELYNKRNKPVEVAGQLSLSEKEATKY